MDRFLWLGRSNRTGKTPIKWIHTQEMCSWSLWERIRGLFLKSVFILYKMPTSTGALLTPDWESQDLHSIFMAGNHILKPSSGASLVCTSRNWVRESPNPIHWHPFIKRTYQDKRAQTLTEGRPREQPQDRLHLQGGGWSQKEPICLHLLFGLPLRKAQAVNWS